MKTHILHDFLNYLKRSADCLQTLLRNIAMTFLTCCAFFFTVSRHAIDDTSMASISPEEITADEIRSITLVDIYAYLSYLDKVKSNSAISRLQKFPPFALF